MVKVGGSKNWWKELRENDEQKCINCPFSYVTKHNGQRDIYCQVGILHPVRFLLCKRPTSLKR